MLKKTLQTIEINKKLELDCPYMGLNLFYFPGGRQKTWTRKNAQL